MLTLLTIVCTVGGYAQETATLTFTKACNGKGIDNKKGEWTITSDAKESTFDTDKGIHYGTTKATVSYLKATSSSYSDKKITKIVVNSSAANSGSPKISCTVGGKAFGETQNLTTANAPYSFSGEATGEIVVNISKNKSTKALYLLSVAVTFEDAAATTTTFGTDSRKTFTFTNGTLEGFTTPTATATKSDDNTDLSNLIEYTSSDADIVAVDSKTGELTFTNTKFGKATITATLPKTDTYQTSTDSYVVENKDNHIATSLSFNGTDVTLTEGKTDAGADFTGYTATEASNIAGTITYAASGDAVATVTPTTGAVTINAAVYGTTTITATFTPADPTQYSGSTATYKITNQQKIDESTIVFDCSKYDQSLIGDTYNNNDNTPRQLKSVAGKDYTFTLTQCMFNNNSIQMAKTKKGKIVSPTFSSFPSGYKVVVTYETDNTPQLYSAELTDAKAEVNKSLKTVSIELPSPTATFTIQSGANYTQIQKIELSALIIKDNPALSFAEATVTKELVAGTIDLQTITKPEDLDASAITYASSDDTTAKVEGNTIHLYKTGEVTITATSAATDKYAAGTASYKLVIEDNRATDTNFKFAAESYSEDLAKATDGIVTFNAANVLQNPNNLKVTYTISPKDENVEIDASTGYIVISKRGIYTITATGDANDTYKETTAKCTLKVFDSTKQDETFTFIAGLHKGTQTGNSKEDQIVQDVVTIHGTNAAFAAITDTEYTYRLYQNSSTTISTKVGKITKIEFIGSNNSLSNYSLKKLTSMTDNNYTCTDHNYGVWEGFAKEVEFKAIAQVRAIQIIVTILIPKEYTMDETKTKNVIEDCAYANVTLQRTLSKEYWNTFCVPFALDAEQVTQYFGEGTQLRTYEGNCNNNTVYFATVDNIEAGKPYIMKPGNAVVQNPTFEGVSMVATGLDENGNPQAVGDASTVQMKGIYNQILLKTDKTELFLGDNDLFYYPIDDIDARTIGGLRAYFIVPQDTDIKKLRANLDGTPTSLDTIFDTEESNAPVYNLQGQCVGNSLRALKSGIYIQNGKKVVVK